jgi:hypothetical protein
MFSAPIRAQVRAPIRALIRALIRAQTLTAAPLRLGSRNYAGDGHADDDKEDWQVMRRSKLVGQLQECGRSVGKRMCGCVAARCGYQYEGCQFSHVCRAPSVFLR